MTPLQTNIAVLAEKPSVARDIARVLGASAKGDGFLHGNGYVITWAAETSSEVGDRHWESVLAYCERQGIAFIAWAPLEAGETGKSGVRQMLRRALGRTSQRSEGIERVARRHGATPSQIALAWLIHRSPVMIPIPGTARRRHLEENVAAAAIKLSPEDLAEISPG